jgi:hypothetical protein
MALEQPLSIRHRQRRTSARHRPVAGVRKADRWEVVVRTLSEYRALTADGGNAWERLSVEVAW